MYICSPRRYEFCRRVGELLDKDETEIHAILSVYNFKVAIGQPMLEDWKRVYDKARQVAIEEFNGVIPGA
jgi:hypothetical protein